MERERLLDKCNIFILTAFVAAGIQLAILALNWMFYNLADFIIGVPMSGGEISVTYGFGLILEHYYPLAADYQPATTSLSFSWGLAVFSYLIIYVVSIIILKAVKTYRV